MVGTMEQGLAAVETSAAQATCEKGALVDPFLVEALQNPRHRLTILWMELDIQKFLLNADQQQFEFQHFPTSYLRLAAHRVAQHYGLLTMVLDNGVDGTMNKILVKKTPESRIPVVRLSEIPAKDTGCDRPENVKIAIKPRPMHRSMSELKELNTKNCPMRSMEERKEEYDKARARIFSIPDSCETGFLGSAETKIASPYQEESEICRSSSMDSDKSFGTRNSNYSRVAILRDKEKDLTDPDYDRSYDRYVKSFSTNQTYGLSAVPKAQVPFVQYDASYPHMGPLAGTQASVSYQPPAAPLMNPFNSVGSNQSLRDASYVPWPSASMMYAHSYEQLRHAVFQAPFCQQPLSFDYSQNH